MEIAPRVGSEKQVGGAYRQHDHASASSSLNEEPGETTTTLTYTNPQSPRLPKACQQNALTTSIIISPQQVVKCEVSAAR